MNKDCDIVEVMNQVRQSKNFRKNFMTEEQKILLRFDKSNVIDALSGEESVTSQSDIDEKIVKGISSNDPSTKCETLIKLDELIKLYAGK